jgi:putative membrane protein
MVMKNKSEKFFTEKEQADIESAIKQAESRTSGEVVAMVVERSSAYMDIDVLAGILFSALIAVYPADIIFLLAASMLRKIIASLNWFEQVPDSLKFLTGLLSFIAITMVLYLPVKLLFRKFPAVKRHILSLKRKEFEVRERAIRAFHEHGLANTRDATGVLFLISILERKVYVLADRGIYAKIKQDTLDKYASSVAKGIASGKGADALCQAIRDAGEVLEKYFPRKSDDKNELSDRMVFEK